MEPVAQRALWLKKNAAKIMRRRKERKQLKPWLRRAL